MIVSPLACPRCRHRVFSHRETCYCRQPRAPGSRPVRTSLETGAGSFASPCARLMGSWLFNAFLLCPPGTASPFAIPFAIRNSLFSPLFAIRNSSDPPAPVEDTRRHDSQQRHPDQAPFGNGGDSSFDGTRCWAGDKGCPHDTHCPKRKRSFHDRATFLIEFCRAGFARRL